MKVIIISGQEATGKSTAGAELAKHLGYQFVSKDAIKEALFDEKPRSTWHYTWYDKHAKAALFSCVERLAQQGESLVVESNFIDEDRPRLLTCLNDQATVREVFFYANGFVSFKRFVRRNESGERHKGHHDRRCYPLIFFHGVLHYLPIASPYKPLGLQDAVLRVDATDFKAINMDKIERFVADAK